MISAPPTFVSRMLLPRLAEFSNAHPSIRVAINSEFRHVEFPRDGVDIAIRMGREEWPGFECTWLLNETLVPVCSPAMRSSMNPESDLFLAPLIHLTSASEDWKTWAAAIGRTIPEQASGIKVDTIQMAMDAASRSMGIAIGRLPIIEADLKSGRLVTLGLPSVKAEVSYWLVTAEGEQRRSDVQAFKTWLLEQLGAASFKPEHQS